MSFDKGNKRKVKASWKKNYFLFSSQFSLKKAQQEAAAQLSRFLNG
jgi:hypothetical protein